MKLMTLKGKLKALVEKFGDNVSINEEQNELTGKIKYVIEFSALRICPICRQSFFPINRKQQYCSARCRSRIGKRMQRIRERAKGEA